METTVNTKKELNLLLVSNKEEIKKYGVKKLGIFGSFVRDEATIKSDIDFFVEFAPEFKTLKNFIGLANLLTKLTGRKVEIVTPQSLNKFIGKYILQEVEYVPIAA